MFRELLEELLRDTGADYCCVADAALGKVLDERGAEPPGAPLSLTVLGWSATAAGHLAAAAADDLDDLIVTSRQAHHLVRQVGAGTARPLLLYVRLDRRRGNLAVALRELAAVRLDRPRPLVVPQPRPRGVAAGGAASSRLLAAPSAPAAGRSPGGLPGIPLPRRQPAALPAQRRVPNLVAPVPVALSALPEGRWRSDVATLQRLLRGLRNLR